jgi:hypothetical protein
LTDFGDLDDEQVEDDRNDDREGERLDDLKESAPGEWRLAGRFVLGRSHCLGGCHSEPV